jgi:hypothetical protein
MHFSALFVVAAIVGTTHTVMGGFLAPSGMILRVHQTTTGALTITTAARDSVLRIQSGAAMTLLDTAHYLRYVICCIGHKKTCSVLIMISMHKTVSSK